MLVTINALEVASNLAHQATYDEQKDIIADESDLFNGENYAEEHQEVFNRWYEYFLDKLAESAIEPSTKLSDPPPPKFRYLRGLNGGSTHNFETEETIYIKSVIINNDVDRKIIVIKTINDEEINLPYEKIIINPKKLLLC